ncbi:MAG: hypothetical protein P8L42_00275 [Flavicella sp.]|nr:hypothetical protein [Flavicella sp.]
MKKVVEQIPAESLALFNETSTYSFDEMLKPKTNENVKGWDEYANLSKFLKKNFTTISPSLALEMSKELADLSKTMNDSLRIRELNNKGMFARLNVFYSEALRLQDMSDISSIQPSEVKEQVEKIILVYNSINLKINSVYLQKSFDENVDFDESIFDFNEEAEAPYRVPKKPRKSKPNRNDKPSFRK